MLEGRKVLEMNDFLIDLKTALDKYGIDQLGCVEEFYGRRDPAKTYLVHAELYSDIGDIRTCVDVHYDDAERDGKMASHCYNVFIVGDAETIYKDGVFYEKPYYGSGRGIMYR